MQLTGQKYYGIACTFYNQLSPPRLSVVKMVGAFCSMSLTCSFIMLHASVIVSYVIDCAG